jgi:FkbM family methyltransferase
MKSFLTHIFQAYVDNKDIRNLRRNFFYYIFYRAIRRFLNRDIKVKIYNFFVWCSFRKNKMSHSIIRKCDFEDLKELNLIKILSRDKSTFIFDCGSNFGFYSLYLASLNENNQVIAFEASPKTYQELKKNIEENEFKNIQCHNLALTNNDNQTLTFFESSNDWESSLIESNFNDKTKTIISSAKLDSFEDRIEKKNQHIIIKLDVEGYEMQVLDGAKKIIEKYSPIIILEFSIFIDKDNKFNYDYLKSFLVQYDYLIFNTNYQEVSLQDVLAEIKNLPKNMFGVGNKFLVRKNSKIEYLIKNF